MLKSDSAQKVWRQEAWCDAKRIKAAPKSLAWPRTRPHALVRLFLGTPGWHHKHGWNEQRCSALLSPVQAFNVSHMASSFNLLSVGLEIVNCPPCTATELVLLWLLNVMPISDVTTAVCRCGSSVFVCKLKIESAVSHHLNSIPALSLSLEFSFGEDEIFLSVCA